LKTKQKHNDFNPSVKNNGNHEAEIRQRIVEATSELNKYYVTMMTDDERMSVNNAEILAKFNYPS
jgi:hypothetical protein